MESDIELLRAWHEGHRDAGERLLDRHFAFVHRYFWRRLPDEAEDLAQKTFLACVEHRSRLRSADSFKAFLFGIARNVLRLALRSQARRHDAELGPMWESQYSPSAVVARAEEHTHLLEAMRRLSAETQIVLELHYWESLKTREIAALLEMPEGTVKTRLREGRARLRELISAASEGLAKTTLDRVDTWAAAVAAAPRTDPS